jgi:hypothetical protein
MFPLSVWAETQPQRPPPQPNGYRQRAPAPSGAPTWALPDGSKAVLLAYSSYTALSSQQSAVGDARPLRVRSAVNREECGAGRPGRCCAAVCATSPKTIPQRDKSRRRSADGATLLFGIGPRGLCLPETKSVGPEPAAPPTMRTAQPLSRHRQAHVPRRTACHGFASPNMHCRPCLPAAPCSPARLHTQTEP